MGITKSQLIKALASFPDDALIEVYTVKKNIFTTEYNYYDIKNVVEDSADGAPTIIIKKREL